VVRHIATSWNQAWTGTNQISHFVLDGDVLTITAAPYKSYLDGAGADAVLSEPLLPLSAEHVKDTT
jgi:hypothetical protein